MSQLSQSNYTLTYFNLRGLAETTRILFAIAKQPFNDVRLEISFNPFLAPEFAKMKESGELDISMGRVPILNYNGEIIAQSKTIERFVAKKLGMAGANEIEEAKIDMICEHLNDIKQKYADCKKGVEGEALEAAKAKFLTEDLQLWMSKLEKCVGSNFAVGTSVSRADVYIHQLIMDYFADDLTLASNSIQSCPKLVSIVDNIKGLVAEYIATRPVTAF
eukprot:gene11965-16016_t